MRATPTSQVLDLSRPPAQPPFGLTWDDLLALPVGLERVFVKVCSGPGRREAARYRHLAGLGLPLPRLLLAIERGLDEVLVLEHLPLIGIRPGEADELLGLAAAWAKVTDLPESFALPPGQPQDVFEDHVAAALTAVAALFPEVEPETWLRGYRHSRDRAQGFPHALTHGEFSFQQVGRTSQGALVAFDLETAGPRPRLTDVATILAPLSGLSSRPELDLFATWLTHGVVAGAAVHELWVELLHTRVIVATEALPWLVSDPELPLADTVRTLARDLAELR